YGRLPSDKKLSRKFFVIFALLNQIQHLFIAMRHGVLDNAEFETYAMQTIRLLKREQSTVAYLLTQRGYAQDFKETILPLFQRAVGPEFPAAAPAEAGTTPVRKS